MPDNSRQLREDIVDRLCGRTLFQKEEQRLLQNKQYYKRSISLNKPYNLLHTNVELFNI